MTYTTYTHDDLINSFLDTVRHPVTQTPNLKIRFHRIGQNLLAHIASDLGYAPEDYEIRSNKAGPAISGEITLHTINLYVQFSQRPYIIPGQPRMDILHRSCKGLNDYVGGSNNFMPFTALECYELFLMTLRSTARKGAAS